MQLERDFRELLSAVKGTDKEKRLASQFITRFMEYFPLLYSEAIDSLLDLCEDDDVSVSLLPMFVWVHCGRLVVVMRYFGLDSKASREGYDWGVQEN